MFDEQQASELHERLRGAACRVANLEDKPYTTRPYPPFTTSTLQQEANRKYGFTARHTMQVAQSLYENGHITYMRTDSTTLATVAIEAARQLVASQYGKEYLPAAPRLYQTKVKNAQEAHEAIRPAGHRFDFPESLRGRLSPDEFKLYDLIWKRTIASQMTDARGHRVTITIEGDGAGVPGQSARRSSSRAICGPMSKDRTTPRPIWRPGNNAAHGGRGRNAPLRDPGAEKPHHPAAQSL